MTHFALSFRYALDGFRNSAGIWAKRGTVLGAFGPSVAFAFEMWSNIVEKSGWMLT